MFMTKKEFNGKIASVKSSSAKVRELVQALLVDAAFYAFKDGNISAITQIIAAVGEGTRKAGIYAWCETFASCRVVNNELKLCKVERAKYNIKTEEDYLALIAETGAKETMWYLTVEAEKAVSVFDVNGYLATVFKKLNSKGLPELADQLAHAVQVYNLEVALENVGKDVEATEEVAA